MQEAKQPQRGLLRLEPAPRRLGRWALMAYFPRFPAQGRMRGLLETPGEPLAEAP